MKILAVDPGERWGGVAFLHLRSKTFHAESCVIDRVAAKSLRETVLALLRYAPGHVIVENYQQRNVGFKRFSGNETLRLIGALQYAAELHGLNWGEVQPGNPDHELPQLPLWGILQSWRSSRVQKNVAWRHSDAAWRVLQRWVLKYNDDLGHALHRSRKALIAAVEVPESRRPPKDSLIVPAIRWRLHEDETL